MDFWDPVRTPSDSSNRYFIVLTDNLSKYVIANVLPDCTAKTTAQIFVDRFLLIRRAPERLITDNGTYFNNHLLSAITSSMKIAHHFPASYHPETNRKVEHYNILVVFLLLKLVQIFYVISLDGNNVIIKIVRIHSIVLVILFLLKSVLVVLNSMLVDSALVL
jgi:hypothetical protein